MSLYATLKSPKSHKDDGIPVPVRTSFGLRRRRRGGKTLYMLNAVKSVLSDVSSVSPLSEQRGG